MAKQVIGVGSAADDGTGDPARTAFQKANANFTELYDVSDAAFIEALQDMIASFLAGSGGATLTYNDAGGALTISTLKHGSHASTPPGVNTDASAGYSVGSTYVVTGTGDRYSCRVATTGQAVWTKMDSADHGGYVSGRWYPTVRGVVAGGQVFSASTARIYPFMVKQRVTITDLGAFISQASAGGAFQMAIYANDAANMRPTGTPLNYTLATLSTTSTGVVTGALQAGGGALTLEPGLVYWAVIAADNTTVRFQNVSTASNEVGFMVGSTTLANIATAAATSILNLSATHTFANNLSALDLTGVTPSENTTERNALFYFKVQ